MKRKSLYSTLKNTINNTTMFTFLVPNDRECDSWYVLLNKAAKMPFELPKRSLLTTMLTGNNAKISVTNSK